MIKVQLDTTFHLRIKVDDSDLYFKVSDLSYYLEDYLIRE